MEWLLVAFIVLVLIAGAAITAPAWGLGLVVALLVYAGVCWLVWTDLAMGPFPESLATARFEEGALKLVENEEEIENYLARFHIKGAMRAASFLATLLTLIVLFLYSYFNFPQAIPFLSVGVVAGPIVLIKVLDWANPQCRIRRNARHILLRRLEGPNQRTKGFTRLVSLAAEVARVTGELGICMPTDPVSSASRSINARLSEILDDPELLPPIIDRLIAEAENDVNGLRTSLDLKYRVVARQKEIRPLVFKACSPSLLDGLDQCKLNLDAAIEALLPAGRWEDFSSFVKLQLEDLEDLANMASTVNEDATNSAFYDWMDVDSADPYKILQMDPTWDVERMKRVYRRWSQLYHPDGGAIADGEREKRVNEAWDKIKNERGIK